MDSPAQSKGLNCKSVTGVDELYLYLHMLKSIQMRQDQCVQGRKGISRQVTAIKRLPSTKGSNYSQGGQFAPSLSSNSSGLITYITPLYVTHMDVIFGFPKNALT